MSQLNASRRKFLRTASVVSGSVGAAAAPFALNMASLGTAAAQTATNDYKAIICMFLYGGNDSSHMVLRTDTASFAEYTRLRNTAPDSIACWRPPHRSNGAAGARRHDRRCPGDHPKFTGRRKRGHTFAVHRACRGATLSGRRLASSPTRPAHVR